MFEESIKESKPRPDFTGTDDFQVSLTLKGEVQNPRFLTFLQHVTQEGLGPFTTQDFLVLDSVQREEPIPHDLKDRLGFLKNRGIIELTGRGRGTKPILSRRFYSFLGKKGVYTRKRGLDRETNKALLLQHIAHFRQEGSRLQDLLQVLPQLTRDQVQKLLRELKFPSRERPNLPGGSQEPARLQLRQKVSKKYQGGVIRRNYLQKWHSFQEVSDRF
jgi:ATP-dependent DNA helicase RecG